MTNRALLDGLAARLLRVPDTSVLAKILKTRWQVVQALEGHICLFVGPDFRCKTDCCIHEVRNAIVHHLSAERHTPPQNSPRQTIDQLPQQLMQHRLPTPKTTNQSVFGKSSAVTCSEINWIRCYQAAGGFELGQCPWHVRG